METITELMEKGWTQEEGHILAPDRAMAIVQDEKKARNQLGKMSHLEQKTFKLQDGLLYGDVEGTIYTYKDQVIDGKQIAAAIWLTRAFSGDVEFFLTGLEEPAFFKVKNREFIVGPLVNNEDADYRDKTMIEFEDEPDRSFYSAKEAIKDLKTVKVLRKKILKDWSYRGQVYLLINHTDKIYFDGFDELKYTPAGRLILVSKETSDKAQVKQEASLDARDKYNWKGELIKKGTRTLAKDYAERLRDKLAVPVGDFDDYLDEWNNEKRETREDETDDFDKSPVELDPSRPIYEMAGNTIREDFYQPDRKGVI